MIDGMSQWTPKDIKKLRQEFSLSQKAFGELIGVTDRYVIYLEKGVRNPSKTMQILLDYIVRYKLERKGGK